jgi:signal transduction histidine kinase/DNA-binding response OmpR family regulator
VAQGRVLIVDDSAEIRQLLAELVLEPNDYHPLFASNGEEGLRLALEEQPQLIILDMQLPRMNGLEVLQELRQREVDIPVIVITVRDSVELAVQAFRLGACDYVVKPFEAQEIHEAIQRVLDANRFREERDRLTQQLMEANQKLERQLQELNAVYAIGRSVTSLLDLDLVLHRVVEAAVYVARAEEGLLLLLDKESGELYLRATKDMDEKAVRSLHMHIDDSIAGRAVQTDRPVLITGENAKIATGYLVQALLYLPLRVPERGVIGILGVANRESEHSFSERDIYLLSALADYAAIAIENARLFEAIEVERAKLEAVLREAHEAIVVTDETGKILLCNAAAHDALNLGKITLYGQSASAVFSHRVLRKMFTEARETNQVVHREVPLDDRRTFNAQFTPIEGVGHVLVMQDITHLKELDRIRSEFVATVSHDLRTPLTNILGYVELLPRAGPLNEQQQEFIGRVRDSMEAITELIGDLLDIGRIEAGYDLEMAPCDLMEVIEETVDNFRSQATGKRQDLRWQPPETLSKVQGNTRTLRQVMENLLSNAMKYTQEGGWIAVSAGMEQGYVVVRVSDNGIGIPPAQQPYIFDRFFRVESEETAGISGTGLGLAIVKAVIEKHNGRVWVESKPGVGSTFCFVLPALKA